MTCVCANLGLGTAIRFAVKVINGLVSVDQVKPCAVRLAAIPVRIDATTTDVYRDAARTIFRAVRLAAIPVRINAKKTDVYRDAARTIFRAVRLAAIPVRINAKKTGAKSYVPT